MQKLILVCFLMIAPFFLFSQQFGGHAPSTRWQQINTDTVRVIFPEGLHKQAADIAATAHRLGLQTYNSIGSRIRKISIVLRPQTTISNGYVGLGPWRSEFLLTPQQNSFELGSLPWHHTLALHEYRHVQQYNNFRKGISGVMYFLFGQDGLALANSAAVPNWFWEGDAVFQETLMSGQGRGRLPFFFNEYRSLWVAGKDYSWMKLRNGSLRDLVPDHYRLGYMMVAYGREKYGEEFWKKVTDDAVRYKGLFYPFQHAVKKYTGKDFKVFRKDAVQYYQSFIEENDKQDTAARWAQQQRHFVADEEYPQWVNNDSLVLVKGSYKKIAGFYMYDRETGGSRKIRVRDIALDNYFSYRNGRIVYASYRPDARWTYKDYSVLNVLDVHTGEQQTITKQTNYFAPDISHDGQQIIAVNVQPGGDAGLHLLNAGGSLLKELPNPQHYFYTYPKFYNDHTIITAIRNDEGAMTLAMVNTNDGSVEELLPWSMHVIGFPAVRNDTITFTASYGETDQLFALVNRQLFRLKTGRLNSGTGNYQLSLGNNKAAWTAFTAAGYHLVTQPLTPADWEPVNREQLQTSLFTYRITALQQGRKMTGDTVATYPVTRYPSSFHLFNFHSWRPYVEDPDYTYSLLGQNVLNTLQTELYFNYNRNERSKDIGASITYAALFPWIKLGTSYTLDRNAVYRNTRVYWNEWQGSAGLQLPLNFSGGRHNRFLNVGTDFVYNKRDFQGIYKDTFDNRGFGYLRSYINFTHQSQKALQHIYPRWAQTLSLNYSTAVTSLEANQFLSTANWYFPGLVPNHNLVFNTAYHWRDTLNNARFSSSFPFSRGYTGLNFHQMAKAGANYHLPLLYPDWGFANIVYFLRVRANLFYDYTYVFDFTSTRAEYRDEYRSYGTEIYFDTKWWNEYDVTFGIRYSRLTDGHKQGLAPNQWEFIVPVNLLQR